jgi:hypothetical protein
MRKKNMFFLGSGPEGPGVRFWSHLEHHFGNQWRHDGHFVDFTGSWKQVRISMYSGTTPGGAQFLRPPGVGGKNARPGGHQETS